MAFLLHNKRLVFVAAGAGMLVGSCAIWYTIGRRLSEQVRCLTHQVELLRQEVSRLQGLVEELLPPRQNRMGNNASYPNLSLMTSDDDEMYEDAYGGPLPWLTDRRSTALISNVDSHSITTDEYITATTDLSSLDNDVTALLFNKSDRLFEGSDGDKREAYNHLLKRKSLLSNDANFLWRLSKATYFVSQIVAISDKEEQKRLVYAAKGFANEALHIDDKNPNAHKWYAIALGSTNDYESVKVKIQNGYDFKRHIERAIELNPADPTGHYLLGRWCFGVYMLSWVERKAAAALFATPPSATIDESLSHFLEADRLNPGTWKENLLHIGKCYIQKRDYSAAVEWLDKANKLPSKGQDDELSQHEVATLLKEYESYRK